MNLELHVIQNVAPSNLNRDDTGAPKDAVFGGHRRARVSSQAWKRAIRQSFAVEFSEDELSWRTKRLIDQVAERLVEQGRDLEQARVVAEAVLTAGGAVIDGDTRRTKVLWLVTRRSAEVLAKLCADHWNAAVSGKDLRTDQEKDIKQVVTTEVVGGRTVDIALFGRMLTDAPDGGTVDAAAQVAHAISTHAVDTEFDYFTAVDDLLPDEEAGAGMIGTVEFNSACYYRYACVDAGQLSENLEGDADLVRRAVEAFARAFVTVMPTGKQNTFAAHNPPRQPSWWFVRRGRGTSPTPSWTRSEPDVTATSCRHPASGSPATGRTSSPCTGIRPRTSVSPRYLPSRTASARSGTRSGARSTRSSPPRSTRC